MSRQVLECGVIVCSTIALYSWAPPSVSEPSLPDCDVSSKSSGAEKSCSPTASQSTKAAPEKSMTAEWGDRHKLPQKIETVYGGLLEQAQAAASRNQITEAVARIAGIPKNSQHYPLAEQLQEDWSLELLRQATSECQQGHVTKAISLLDRIPATSKRRDRVIELRQRWSQQAGLLERATAAKKAGDWQTALDAVKALEGSPMYHSTPVQDLLQQAMMKLYEPDQMLLQVATADLPMARSAIAPPESILLDRIDLTDDRRET